MSVVLKLFMCKREVLPKSPASRNTHGGMLCVCSVEKSPSSRNTHGGRLHVCSVEKTSASINTYGGWGLYVYSGKMYPASRNTRNMHEGWRLSVCSVEDSGRCFSPGDLPQPPTTNSFCSNMSDGNHQ